ncbi:MAG TPA: hypothetical protein VK452_01005 [Dissulfurispiraceae bacterium]|nr:hypothetical protein [Dissulfurispiraceae bacterium]
MQDQCLGCVHFRGSFEKNRPSCTAFPLGIPDNIWEGDFDHNNPFEGDNNVRFEAVAAEE